MPRSKKERRAQTVRRNVAIAAITLVAGCEAWRAFAVTDAGMAERAIRFHLAVDAFEAEREELRVSGSPVPSEMMTRRWEERRAALDEVLFAAIEVRACVVSPLWGGGDYVLRAHLLDRLGNDEVRYFFVDELGGSELRVLRETSVMFWALPL